MTGRGAGAPKRARPRVRLIHWNDAEARERAARLEVAGYEVVADVPNGPGFLRELRETPPAAVVIDLSRIPSQGRDVGLAIRQYRATRHVPLVFVEGEPAKMARARELLPDAAYTTWGRIRGALKATLSRPPADPVVPASRLAGYAGAPLAKKLGIRPGSTVALIGAPSGFERTLGRLPDGVVLRRRGGARRDLTLWFTRSRLELDRRVGPMAAALGGGRLWIVWPKKASGLDSGLSQVVVRKVGLAAGLVDFKICAVDDTWSGLQFVRRRTR